MSTDRKSIAQIKKEFAEAKEGSLEELFAQYAMDERSGVKAVLNSYRKKQEKLAKERVRLEEMRSYEHRYERYGYVCGIDEAGRGPLAGPVVAGAVILPEDCEILWLNDSKQLSEKKREALYDDWRRYRSGRRNQCNDLYTWTVEPENDAQSSRRISDELGIPRKRKLFG